MIFRQWSDQSHDEKQGILFDFESKHQSEGKPNVEAWPSLNLNQMQSLNSLGQPLKDLDRRQKLGQIEISIG